jgi:hypothetical protein
MDQEEQPETKKNYRDIYEFVPKIGKPKLLGSASNTNVREITDYDLICKIKQSDIQKVKSATTEKMQGRYLIEIKIEGENNKEKFVKRRSFDLSDLKTIFFIKLDFVIWKNYSFREMSIIYDLNEPKDTESFEDKIKADIVDYIAEKNYFKVIKRLYSLTKFRKNTKNANKLLRFINDTGVLGSTLANLKAIQLVKEKYPNDKIIKKLVKINLKDIGVKESELTKMTDRISEKLNVESKQFLKKK